MLSSDASLGMWATDGGRTQVPGFLMHLVLFVVASTKPRLLTGVHASNFTSETQLQRQTSECALRIDV
jgi:hypothetical protein